MPRTVMETIDAVKTAVDENRRAASAGSQRR
jgi:hypothetical protein